MWVVWSTIILPPGLVSYSSFSNIFHRFGVLFSEFFILAAKKFNSQEPPFFLLFLLFPSLCSGKVKVTQACPSLCDPMDYTVHGILQVRILEWIAFSFFRGPSQPRDWTQVSRIVGRFFTSWATREACSCIHVEKYETWSYFTSCTKNNFKWINSFHMILTGTF